MAPGAQPEGAAAAAPKTLNEEMQRRAEIHEYTSTANPPMALIPVKAHVPALHMEGPTRIEYFDLHEDLQVEYTATSPNLLAAFIRVVTGESLQSTALATSQAFYVIRGTGSSESEFGVTEWAEGDLFVLPTTEKPIVHRATGGAFGGAALYWVSDEPLMRYLGTLPNESKFEPTMWTRAALLDRVEEIRHVPGATERNRCGVLLGNSACPQTKTLTHVLWSLLNSLAPQSVQRPHRHNSVALDLAVHALPNVYTLMSPSIDAEGTLVNPVRVDWIKGGVFVTPPGWWHSHHNESDEMAWVLPMQDAGLYTYQRTLDIRFVDEEVRNADKGVIWGSSFTLKRKERQDNYTDVRAGLGSYDNLAALGEEPLKAYKNSNGEAVPTILEAEP
jgi:gentisate 1,2-dioxygenase